MVKFKVIFEVQPLADAVGSVEKQQTFIEASDEQWADPHQAKRLIESAFNTAARATMFHMGVSERYDAALKEEIKAMEAKRHAAA